MKSTFKVLFYLKKGSEKRNGEVSIMTRVTVDGKVCQFSTKQSILPENWNVKAGKATGKSAGQINKLLDDIMTVSRAQTIGVDMALEAVDLIALCDAVCNEARLIDQHRHELVFEASPDMCPQIIVDERLFRQMLENLISNAFKYSPPGSTVRIALDCDHENMWLAVHDEGVGVPMEAQNHLFDAFFRAGNVGAVSGTGLGLALVKLVVDLHNGKIEVQSREGRGSTFIITLPVAPPESEKTPE